ncbi:MAG: hypothetical protein RLZZ01_2654, partial [Actinomycetota bacterium]
MPDRRREYRSNMPVGLRRPGLLLVTVIALLTTIVQFGAEPAAAAAPGFRSIVPTRVLDTRDTASPLGPRDTRRIDLASIAPSDASAVVVNLTGVSPTEETYLTAWPGGTTQPFVSNLNVPPGVDRANSAVIGLGGNRSIDVFNWTGSIHVVIDVTGWMTGSAYVGTTPTRLLDTREGAAAPVAGGSSVAVRVAGVAGVPADATAVAVNLTATEATATTFLTAWPTGAARPWASNLNLQRGDTRANLVVLKVGADGFVNVFNDAGTSHVVLDLFGYFRDTSTFTGRVPERLLDTRERTCGFRLGPGETRTLTISDASAVGGAALNVTAVSPTASTYITVWPTGARRPLASSLNTDPSVFAAPNMVLTGLGSAGQVNIYNNAGYVDMVVDVTGTFAGVRSDDAAPVPCVTGPTPVNGWFGSQSVLPQEQPWIGEDLIAMWTCVESGVAPTVDVDLDQLSAMLNVYVAEYYLIESVGRYRPVFVNAGTIVLRRGFDPFECSYESRKRTTAPYTNTVAFDVSERGLFGFAGPGANSNSNRNPLLPVTSTAPDRSGRALYVSGGNVDRVELDWGRDFSLIAHELGHTLGWPHSYSGTVASPWDPSLPDEYDNPFDLMSGAAGQTYVTCLSTPWQELYTEYCRVPATIAANRIAAGWLDSNRTVTHSGGSRTLQLADAGNPALTQAVVAPSSRTAGQFVVVQAYTREHSGFRVDIDGDGRTEYHSTVFPTTGVAVHVVEGSRNGLGRR